MSEQHRPNVSRIEQEAIAWVQRLGSGTASADEVAAAEGWRLTSPAHADAYDNAERVWQRMAMIGRAKYGRDADFMGPLQDYGRRRAAMTRRAVLGVGVLSIGAAAIYGAARPPLDLWPSLAELRADYRTGTGEQRMIAFADHVQIAMNTQTSLSARPATATEDRVELIAGEASFATPAGARALAVFAADGKVSSDTGRFEMRCYDAGNRVAVTCFEGRLHVQSRAQAAELAPGQRVSYDGAGIGTIAAIDSEAVSEWRRGVVAFHNTPLSEAVGEMNRYRSGRIILKNATQGQRLLSGRFRIDQMEQAIAQVEHTFKLSVTRYPGGIVVLS